ncbi:MAG: MarR family transcriptional regulator [Dehalococcoidales bacterium]|jgi:DNA-binding MarR family transcriptional regulator
MNTQDTIENIVENLFYAIPVIHKKLMKIDPPDIEGDIHISRLHIGIMALLNENILPISEIANTFLIPKPQMTYLLNQMVKAGLVEKAANINDRRITDVILTPKGKETFKRCDEFLKNNVRIMLAYLTEKELEELAVSLSKLKEIGPKLGSRGKPNQDPGKTEWISKDNAK